MDHRQRDTATPTGTNEVSLTLQPGRSQSWVARSYTGILGGLLAGIFGLAVIMAGVEEWTYLAYAAWTGVLLAIWGLVVAASGQPLPVPPRRIALPLIAFTATCIVIFLQSAPWMPANWQHPIWSETRAILETEVAGAISIDPGASRRGLLALLAFAATFWLALQLGRSSRRARMGLKAFITFQSVLALVGITAFLAGNDALLFFEKHAYGDSVTGTFVNRNSYATFVGLGLIAALGLVVEDVKSRLRQDRARAYNLRISIETLFAKQWAVVLGIVIMAVALVLTKSRAGNVSTAAALIVLPILIGRTRWARRRFITVVFLCVAILGIGVLWLGGEGLNRRLAPERTEASLEQRLDLYDSVLIAIRDNWALGSGYKTFRQAFYPYIERDMLSYRSWFDAHNTYLEKILELGVFGAAALFLTVGSLVALCWRGVVTRRRDTLYPAIGVAGSILVGLHALVDFSLEIPAVAAAYCLILGLGVAQSFSSREAL